MILISRVAWRVPLLHLLLLITVPLTIYAEPVVRHSFRSSSPDTEIEEILFLSAGVALVELGYSSVREPSPGAPAVTHNLIADYSLDNGMISIRYIVADSEMEEITSLEVSSELNVDVDRRISAVVRELWEEGDLPIASSPEARIYGIGQASVSEDQPVPEARPVEAVPLETVPEDATPEPAAMAPAPDTPSNEERSDSPGSADSATDASARSESGTGTDTAGTPEPVHQWTATSFGGFSLIVGDGSSLFRNTVFVSVGLDRFRIGRHLGYGVVGTVHRAFKNEEVDGGALVVTTVGPAVRLRFLTDDDRGARIGFVVGPSVVTVSVDGDLLNKVVPFTDVTATAVLGLTDHLRAGLSIGSVAVFEDTMVLVGLTTSLSITVVL